MSYERSSRHTGLLHTREPPWTTRFREIARDQSPCNHTLCMLELKFARGGEGRRATRELENGLSNLVRQLAQKKLGHNRSLTISGSKVPRIEGQPAADEMESGADKAMEGVLIRKALSSRSRRRLLA